MISYITGTIRSLTREPGRAVIIAGGVGYEVSLPTYVYQSLANDGIREGSDVELEIYYHVTERQPKPMLVGFRHPSEKQFFEQLIQVEGIGPAKAASALVFPVSTIASAIETEDLGSLQRLPGIGSRAAQKIVATLRGKVTATALLQDAGISEQGQTPPVADARSEAIEALVTLGYRPTEAQDKVEEAIRRTPEVADDLQDLMREVFKAQISAQD
ncbi:MAG: Holliday junction branch migration protein RuvA [Dehalococcoidia bacterium]|jgi:Holliday junction DNA helicase RuvA|nr:Holliday junction DNA helicase RuvA [Chloroflexota bacterium]MDP6056636.1 Holliday junction branch migration protein RuvA [Dehalococcoidia bacterium]MDP7090214.1 Holliday junction branch migration protein RuvA [Dehalococcoidia bacterium]MDP7261350.1 Holliday junction branch migration protein RuvA [Dehalococcoidia bacterium]MDP7484429.1 Holliday junction branch migration protein RuvA [Dehalococcoidia bacterium]|tara:strand:+ start:7741 stop:8385 length:645 start_codon:yes stop_codon:yes gene_type:complete